MAGEMEVTVQKDSEEVVNLSSEAGKEFGEEGGPDKVEDVKVEEEVKPEEKVEEKEKAEEDPREVELRSLRAVAREQRKELSELKESIAKTTKVLEEANLITEEDKEKERANQELYNKRMDELETIQEMMRLNPAYSDLDDVCSQERWDEMVEIMATALSKADPKEGSVTEISKKLENELWSLKNPYRYMYDQIKKYHPDFVKAEPAGPKVPKDAGEASKLEAAKEAVKKGKGSGAVGPGSVHDIPGGDSSANVGWTAARIDSMSEEELSKVPPDIYDRYLRNQLK